MHVRQYLHFSVASRHVSAVEITARLGMEPDEIAVRGGRLADPATPPAHAWTVTCTQPGLSVNGQLLEIVARLRPCLDEIIALSEELAAADPDHGGASLELVSYLDDRPATAPEPVLDPLRQWALEREALQLLLAAGPSFDLDIYG